MIENAKIANTFLGIEDHGILTAQLMLEGPAWGQVFGGMALDGPCKVNGKFVGRRGHAFGMDWIRHLLEVLEIESWEKVAGVHVRIERENGRIERIGHLLKDRWFMLEGRPMPAPSQEPE